MAASIDNPRIGFIGAGRLAGAVVRGLGEPVLVSSRTPESAAALAAEVGGEAVIGNAALAQRAGVVVLAVEPQAFDAVAAEIAEAVAGKPVISLLARTSLRTLRVALPDAVVARAMPNVAAAVRRSATGISDEAEAGLPAVAITREVFDRVGTTFPIPDRDMDVVAWLCGSGPAWSCFAAQTVIDAAVESGIERETAERFAAQGLRDAAESVAGSERAAISVQARGLDPEMLSELREAVAAATASAFDAALSLPSR